MGACRVRRVYEQSPPGTFRILVDRLWPRGLSKEDAGVDLWLKEAAPSAALRTWFAHDPARFEEFARRYRGELEGSEAFAVLVRAVRDHDAVDLVYSARDSQHNQAVVLLGLLDGR
ncbi:DUF488 domain-containing protein [Sinomonas halotolerans]|uniref:DUF488 family protein n=1 Tax=Sinomonas halotolerans TaxID=1644133 RepID=A0ABU9WZS1_9MICC